MLADVKANSPLGVCWSESMKLLKIKNSRGKS